MIRPITQTEINQNKVAALPSRPNASTAFGGAGYTSLALKQAFDRLPMLLAERYNELVKTILASDENGLLAQLSSGILDDEGNPYSLKDILEHINDGRFASYLKVGESYLDLLLATLAPLQSPAFSGTPTATTADASDTSTRIATTEWVKRFFDQIPKEDETNLNLIYTLPFDATLEEVTQSQNGNYTFVWKDENGQRKGIPIRYFTRTPLLGEMFWGIAKTAHRDIVSFTAKVTGFDSHSDTLFQLLDVTVLHKGAVDQAIENIPRQIQAAVESIGLDAMWTMEPPTKMADIIPGHRNSFGVQYFNRTPVLGDKFFCYGISSDGISFHMTAQITGLVDDGNGGVNAAFEVLEVTSCESDTDTHNTDTDAHQDIRGTIAALQAAFEAFLDVDDKTLDQLSEIVAYIQSNEELIDEITTSKVSVANIINNLTTSALDKPLSAAQGVKLKALIDALSDAKLDKSALTNAINQALAQAKSSGDFNGFSPTVSVSKLNGVTTVTINDILGPQTATIKDGASVSIKRISESDDDGGENTVTFTSNGTDKTLTIKNGTQGSPGVGIKSITQTISTKDDGINKIFITKTDGTVGEYEVKNGSKGSPGTTPVKGVDYFTETDLQEIVVRCVDAIKEGGVVGVVDEDKNILMSGNLEDGTYTLSYEREDGTVCGTTLVITAPIAEPKNFFVIDGEGYILNGRCNSEGLDRQDTGAYIVTNYMDVQAGDIIRLSGAPLSQVEAGKSGMKLTNGSLVGFTSDNTEFISNGIAVNGVTEFTITKADADAVRLCLCLLAANNNTSKPIDNTFVENQNIVINIQRDGVWLTK